MFCAYLAEFHRLWYFYHFGLVVIFEIVCQEWKYCSTDEPLKCLHWHTPKLTDYFQYKSLVWTCLVTHFDDQLENVASSFQDFWESSMDNYYLNHVGVLPNFTCSNHSFSVTNSKCLCLLIGTCFGLALVWEAVSMLLPSPNYSNSNFYANYSACSFSVTCVSADLKRLLNEPHLICSNLCSKLPCC